MRKRISLCIFCSVAVLSLLGSIVDVYAATTPFIYEVTFKKFELKKQDGTYVSVWSGSAVVDLADLASGNFADLTFLEDLDVPSGTYTAFRASLDKTMSVECDNGTQQTDGGTLSPGVGLGSLPKAEVATGSAQEGDLVLPDALLTGGVYLFEETFAGPVTVVDGDALGEFEIVIDVDNTFEYVDLGLGNLAFQGAGGDPEPSVTVNVPAGF